MRQARCMKTSVLAMSVMGIALLGGCGQQGDEEGIDTVRGALGTFGAWTAIPNGTFLSANPALTSGGLDMDAYAWGTDGQVWFNFKATPDTWNGGWTQFDNNGVSFAGPPAAAEYDFFMVNHVNYTALAEADASGTFSVRVSNTSGGGVPDWTAVPNGTFLGQPALAVS